jgi:DNA-binding HxlR family transcriptional regulator
VNSGRIYPHFCMTARALEEVGERWSLLIVRDLLLGPMRFSDLARSVGGITPTRLTDRLRSLEAAGLIIRQEQETGREVRYRLTETGEELRPVIEALGAWGFRNAGGPPREGEQVHPDHVMLANKVLDQRRSNLRAPVVWAFDFGGDAQYTLGFDGSAWDLARGGSEDAAVTVTTTPEAWARFLTTEAERRQLPAGDIELEGSAAALKTFARAHQAELKHRRRR